MRLKKGTHMIGKCPRCKKPMANPVFRENKYWHPSCWKKSK